MGETDHERKVQENYRQTLKEGYERMGVRKTSREIETEAKNVARQVEQNREAQKKGRLK